ncbi:MAG: DUF3429 domain-containing protein [Acetobacteraceae bacterium]|nr:DUF3429 domain-containing protein [Acetobacteraceae bacterium]
MDTQTTRTAWLLGLAGLIPFFVAALGVAAGPEDWRDFAKGALLGYAAVILSFLGAVHWGLALRAPAEEAAFGPARLALGVVPSLVAWLALLLPEQPAYALLVAGLLGTAGTEQWGALRGLVPRGYMGLRWLLTGCASLALVAAWAAS